MYRDFGTSLTYLPRISLLAVTSHSTTSRHYHNVPQSKRQNAR